VRRGAVDLAEAVGTGGADGGDAVLAAGLAAQEAREGVEGPEQAQAVLGAVDDLVEVGAAALEVESGGFQGLGGGAKVAEGGRRVGGDGAHARFGEAGGANGRVHVDLRPGVSDVDIERDTDTDTDTANARWPRRRGGGTPGRPRGGAGSCTFRRSSS